MKATQFEFRFRLWISFVIYCLGFWAPWLRYGSLATPFTTTRLELAGEFSRWLPLQTASIVVTSAAILLAAVGAVLRVWGTAHSNRAEMRSGDLGGLLFAAAVAIFMPPTGAALFLTLILVQTFRLMQFPRPVGKSAHIRWPQAVIAEVFYIAMAICLAVLAWRYDPTLLIQALLICFGFSLVARAFVPQPA